RDEAVEEPRRPRSRWEGEHSVADVAKRVDVFATLWWHRRWERRPLRFVFLAAGVVLASLLVNLLPDAGGGADAVTPPPLLSPLELAGRDIYIAEGCNQCHTQQVRPILAETRRYGPYSLPS